MADVGKARRMVLEQTCAMGFDDRALAELEIAVTELATNLVVHHCVDGEVIAKEITDPLGQGIEMVTRDRGPGIPDLKRALDDHHSTGGSMGCGLGAVRRLMDEFDIYSHVTPRRPQLTDRTSVPYGTVVVARKWVVDRDPSRPFVHSAYSRPCLGNTANGDSCFVSDERDGLLVAVADGLGHGSLAQEAGCKSIEFVRENKDMEFGRLIPAIDELLRQTRGVALTLVRIRLSDRTVIHTGIGNVEARVYPRGKAALIPRAGILGGGIFRPPKVSKVPWPEGGMLFVFTDGVSGRWDLEEIPGVHERHVTTIANLLMREYGRTDDDATLVVAKELIW
jgi:anti-sigma regulatory factor (Ser/Thr protein kinase)